MKAKNPPSKRERFILLSGCVILFLSIASLILRRIDEHLDPVIAERLFTFGIFGGMIGLSMVISYWKVKMGIGSDSGGHAGR